MKPKENLRSGMHLKTLKNRLKVKGFSDRHLFEINSQVHYFEGPAGIVMFEENNGDWGIYSKDFELEEGNSVASLYKKLGEYPFWNF